MRLKRATGTWPALAALLFASCGGAPPEAPSPRPAEGPPVLPQSLERLVAPFPVLDERGDPYEHPFLGGFVVPRPQFVDITGDGVSDLFVQERSGELIHFENTGSATEPRFVWRTDRFQDLDIGEWFRFVDLDGDGRADLLAEQRFSHIRVFHNRGPAEAPRFEAVPDTLRDISGAPIFADRQNIPSIVDLECDGRLDLFLGRVEGTITRYREVDRGGAAGLPRFERATDRFEDIEIIGQVGTLHGANSMAWMDLRGTGALDLFWGDFFEPGLLFIENTKPCPGFSLAESPLVPVPTEGEPVSTSGFNAPTFADLSGSGQQDLFIGVLGGAFNPNTTAHANFHHWEQAADGSFRLVTERFLTAIDVGSESVVAFEDLTGNGLPDMAVGNRLDPGARSSGRLYLFLNRGEPGAPRLHLADTLALPEAYHYAPAFADLFGDGRPALVLGTWNDGVRIFRNLSENGEIRFAEEPELTLQVTRGSHTVPALADLTGNGLVDLLVGVSSGRMSFFRNVGTSESPEFELVTDAFRDIDVGRRASPQLVDVDGDGLPDLLIGSESGDAFLYRNVGGPAQPAFELDEAFRPVLHPVSTPRLVDLDLDGRLELLSGGLSGGVLYFRRPLP